MMLQEFSNAGRKLKDVIYPDDYEAVFNNISELQNGHISCHNMEYQLEIKKERICIYKLPRTAGTKKWH